MDSNVTDLVSPMETAIGLFKI